MSEQTLQRGPNRVRIVAWALAALLLCVPLVAMQFENTGFDWDETDFIVAGMIVGGIGLMAEFLVRVSRDGFYRAGAACALAAIFLTVWSNLAVGIVGNEDNMFNVWYFGVVLLAILGAALVRFRAGGMATVSLLAIACMAVLGVVSGAEGYRIWPQTGFLATPWALAAAFFWHAWSPSRD